MMVSTIFLALALCGAIEGLQQAFRVTPSLLTLTGPGAQYARVVPFAAPPERASVGGYGPSYYDDIQDATSQVEATATASAKSFFVPPPPPLAATDPATQTCAFAPRFCPNSRYRSLDGSCNNRKRPTWGMPQTPYGRLTPYNYGDGISSMPRAASGNQLPNARELSFRLFVDKHLIDPFFSLITQQWGQIITHDMSLAANRPSTGGAACCSSNGQLQSGVTTNPACAPIIFPPNDPIHAQEGTQCQNFLRSGTTTTFGCTPPNVPAAPLTSVTAFLDLSLVYGNSASQIAPLRARSGGRMLTLVRNGQEWPPQDPNVTTACRPARTPFEPCYLTGDVRANQNSQLTLLQIILLREHNRIADVLAHLNPHWNDETLFQEARRINIAQTQYISYYEYLPILLGFDNMVQNKLIYPYKHVDHYNPYVNDYNPDVDPAVLNEHATAAFRHFHTLIRGFLKLVNENRQFTGTVRISDWLNRPLVLEIEDSFAKLARGLTTQEMDFSDQWWDSEMTEFLFRGNRTFGGDLRATDIQRGRDQGLGSYVTTRAACELPIPKTFHDMLDYISHENVDMLQNMYESPQDVDLVVAGSLERNVPGALAGPTFLCILTEQFYRTRVGDRYFFENGGDPETAFTPSQLAAIRNANMARLMCDNTEGIQLMQPEAFRVISHDNKLVPCSELPFVDLTLWQDARGHKK